MIKNPYFLFFEFLTASLLIYKILIYGKICKSYVKNRKSCKNNVSI